MMLFEDSEGEKMEDKKQLRFKQVAEVMRGTNSHPSKMFAAQDKLCQLYGFDYIRTFIYSYKEGKCSLAHTSQLGKEPVVSLLARGIDLTETYYGKLGDETSDKLVSEVFTHTRDLVSIQDSLLGLGYEPHEDKVVGEIATHIVHGKNNTPIVLIALERFEGTALLTDEEVDEIQMLMEFISIRIENYENQKQTRDLVAAKKSDPLTGLRSLSAFREDVESLLESEIKYAMVGFDVDKFKYINEIWSEELGDQILKEVGTVVADFVAEDESCCRLAADKFAVMLTYTNEAHLVEKVEELNQNLKAMQEKLFSDVKVTMIGGVYKISDRTNISLALDRANIARSTVKGSFDNEFVLYSTELSDLTEREKQLEKRMKHALENHEFIPYLQPKFDIRTKKICGAEALARWVIDGRLVSPAEFIPIFEKNGFIIHLDFAIYEGVFAFIKACREKGYELHPISVNVSRGHMRDNLFCDRFLGLMSQYGIGPESIELEITESVFMGDKDILAKFIKSLRQKKIAISIDDFGTAYSSLNLLKDIEVDVIKLDKSFIDSIAFSNDKTAVEKDKIIVKNMIKMIEELKFESVFEGIETEEQIDFLKGTSCTIGQGFIFSKPLPLTEFEEKYLKS